MNVVTYTYTIHKAQPCICINMISMELMKANALVGRVMISMELKSSGA